MTVTYGQRGYIGMSRSVRAAEAEEHGRLPLTRAIKDLAGRLGITQKAARAALVRLGPCEYHHVGKYAAAIDYYDVDAAERTALLQRATAGLPARWRDQISAAMTAADKAALAAATAAGIPQYPQPGWHTARDGRMEARCAARDAACATLAAATGVSVEDIHDAYYHA